MSDLSAAHCSTEILKFDDCAGWAQDDHSAALDAFLKSAIYAETNSYKSGILGPQFEDLLPVFAKARSLAATQEIDRQAARAFFECYFYPVKITPHDQQTGFVTGFYEPEIAASRIRTAEFSVPFYRKPADLIKLDSDNRPENLPEEMAFGRTYNGQITEYFDRQAIEQGALTGQGLEIAYVADKVDAYFAHVQGAVRLNFTDGSQMRLTYAAKSGHGFTGAGRVLIDKGELEPAKVTMQTIRQWLAEYPARIDEILWHNRSYIFFREAPVDDLLSGPVAAAKVPLTAQRSLAVDRKYHCFGTPFFINVRNFPDRHGVFHRLMIAQDTGTAIVGPARGDLFIGSGDAAGQLAGQIRHDADFIMLVPRLIAEG
ncbi:murein transglycosylase A [Pseudochrobactrum sp. sp1633]|uniref:murein transglycosylase A n=1 Tax=Pseudochrobactrum sp. sp1633 TaxID=3036706 RepID=UPI0025A4FA57|nr:murein transglycosylase A [Pseudochrobactrum sp. sp1633]MDM8344985.1 murein transglycosylase A [Pseudochrobactrum sp. sp1633]HWD14817.1 murein transglycosylase A [Pseudochrobactrum sp.]